MILAFHIYFSDIFHHKPWVTLLLLLPVFVKKYFLIFLVILSNYELNYVHTQQLKTYEFNYVLNYVFIDEGLNFVLKYVINYVYIQQLNNYVFKYVLNYVFINLGLNYVLKYVINYVFIQHQNKLYILLCIKLHIYTAAK